ncbi:LysM peptidoglycan-binding domain-containing protein [Paraburkholderia phosphatilytica]|uniref:LysM peptidoglycan-binding domain-containing protein n=1 Tax=Paraburkholderia phosphatilytica TaxID=2282883 RepID=UPI000E4B364F|nr:LysM peptidoglycan-binding domain-containing protein [Paraburkholderia phosphatilytica]
MLIGPDGRAVPIHYQPPPPPPPPTASDVSTAKQALQKQLGNNAPDNGAALAAAIQKIQQENAALTQEALARAAILLQEQYDAAHHQAQDADVDVIKEAESQVGLTHQFDQTTLDAAAASLSGSPLATVAGGTPSSTPTVSLGDARNAIQTGLDNGMTWQEAVNAARVQFGGLTQNETVLDEAALTVKGDQLASGSDATGGNVLGDASQQLAGLHLFDDASNKAALAALTVTVKPSSALAGDAKLADTAWATLQQDEATHASATVINEDWQVYHTALDTELNDAANQPAGTSMAWLNDPSKSDLHWLAQQSVIDANTATSLKGAPSTSDLLTSLRASAIVDTAAAARGTGASTPAGNLKAAQTLTQLLQGVPANSALYNEVMGDMRVAALHDAALADITGAHGDNPQDTLIAEGNALSGYRNTVLFPSLLKETLASSATQHNLQAVGTPGSLTDIANLLDAVKQASPELAQALFSQLQGKIVSLIGQGPDYMPVAGESMQQMDSYYGPLARIVDDAGGPQSAQTQQVIGALKTQMQQQLSTMTNEQQHGEYSPSNPFQPLAYLNNPQLNDPTSLYQTLINQDPNSALGKTLAQYTGLKAQPAPVKPAADGAASLSTAENALDAQLPTSGQVDAASLQKALAAARKDNPTISDKTWAEAAIAAQAQSDARAIDAGTAKAPQDLIAQASGEVGADQVFDADSLNAATTALQKGTVADGGQAPLTPAADGTGQPTPVQYLNTWIAEGATPTEALMLTRAWLGGSAKSELTLTQAALTVFGEQALPQYYNDGTDPIDTAAQTLKSLNVIDPSIVDEAVNGAPATKDHPAVIGMKQQVTPDLKALNGVKGKSGLIDAVNTAYTAWQAAKTTASAKNSTPAQKQAATTALQQYHAALAAALNAAAGRAPGDSSWQSNPQYIDTVWQAENELELTALQSQIDAAAGAAKGSPQYNALMDAFQQWQTGLDALQIIGQVQYAQQINTPADTDPSAGDVAAAYALTYDVEGLSSSTNATDQDLYQQVMGDTTITNLQSSALATITGAAGAPKGGSSNADLSARLHLLGTRLQSYSNTIFGAQLIDAAANDPATRQLFAAIAASVNGQKTDEGKLTTLADTLEGTNPTVATMLLEYMFPGSSKAHPMSTTQLVAWTENANDMTQISRIYSAAGDADTTDMTDLRHGLEQMVNSDGNFGNVSYSSRFHEQTVVDEGGAVVWGQDLGFGNVKKNGGQPQLAQDMLDDSPDSDLGVEIARETGYSNLGKPATPIDLANPGNAALTNDASYTPQSVSGPFVTADGHVAGLQWQDGMQTVTSYDQLLNQVGEDEGLTTDYTPATLSDQQLLADGQFALFNPNDTVFDQNHHKTTLGQVVQSLMHGENVTTLDGLAPMTVASLSGRWWDTRTPSQDDPGEAFSLLEGIDANGRMIDVGPADTTARYGYSNWQSNTGFDNGFMVAQPHWVTNAAGIVQTGSAYLVDYKPYDHWYSWDNLKSDLEIAGMVVAGVIALVTVPESAPLWMVALSEAADAYFAVTSAIGTVNALQQLGQKGGAGNWLNWLNLAANMFGGAASGLGALARAGTIMDRVGVGSEAFENASGVIVVAHDAPEIELARAKVAAQLAGTRAVRVFDDSRLSGFLRDHWFASGGRLFDTVGQTRALDAMQKSVAFRLTGLFAAGTNGVSMLAQGAQLLNSHGQATAQDWLNFFTSAGLMASGLGLENIRNGNPEEAAAHLQAVNENLPAGVRLVAPRKVDISADSLSQFDEKTSARVALLTQRKIAGLSRLAPVQRVAGLLDGEGDAADGTRATLTADEVRQINDALPKGVRVTLPDTGTEETEETAGTTGTTAVDAASVQQSGTQPAAAEPLVGKVLSASEWSAQQQALPSAEPLTGVVLTADEVAAQQEGDDGLSGTPTVTYRTNSAVYTTRVALPNGVGVMSTRDGSDTTILSPTYDDVTGVPASESPQFLRPADTLLMPESDPLYQRGVDGLMSPPGQHVIFGHGISADEMLGPDGEPVSVDTVAALVAPRLGPDEDVTLYSCYAGSDDSDPLRATGSNSTAGAIFGQRLAQNLADLTGRPVTVWAPPDVLIIDGDGTASVHITSTITHEVQDARVPMKAFQANPSDADASAPSGTTPGARDAAAGMSPPPRAQGAARLPLSNPDFDFAQLPERAYGSADLQPGFAPALTQRPGVLADVARVVRAGGMVNFEQASGLLDGPNPRAAIAATLRAFHEAGLQRVQAVFAFGNEDSVDVSDPAFDFSTLDPESGFFRFSGQVPPSVEDDVAAERTSADAEEEEALEVVDMTLTEPDVVTLFLAGGRTIDAQLLCMKTGAKPTRVEEIRMPGQRGRQPFELLRDSQGWAIVRRVRGGSGEEEDEAGGNAKRGSGNGADDGNDDAGERDSRSAGQQRVAQARVALRDAQTSADDYRVLLDDARSQVDSAVPSRSEYVGVLGDLVEGVLADEPQAPTGARGRQEGTGPAHDRAVREVVNQAILVARSALSDDALDSAAPIDVHARALDYVVGLRTANWRNSHSLVLRDADHYLSNLTQEWQLPLERRGASDDSPRAPSARLAKLSGLVAWGYDFRKTWLPRRGTETADTVDASVDLSHVEPRRIAAAAPGGRRWAALGTRDFLRLAQQADEQDPFALVTGMPSATDASAVSPAAMPVAQVDGVALSDHSSSDGQALAAAPGLLAHATKAANVGELGSIVDEVRIVDGSSSFAVTADGRRVLALNRDAVTADRETSLTEVLHELAHAKRHARMIDVHGSGYTDDLGLNERVAIRYARIASKAYLGRMDGLDEATIVNSLRHDAQYDAELEEAGRDAHTHAIDEGNARQWFKPKRTGKSSRAKSSGGADPNKTGKPSQATHADRGIGIMAALAKRGLVEVWSKPRGLWPGSVVMDVAGRFGAENGLWLVKQLWKSGAAADTGEARARNTVATSKLMRAMFGQGSAADVRLANWKDPRTGVVHYGIMTRYEEIDVSSAQAEAMLTDAGQSRENGVFAVAAGHLALQNTAVVGNVDVLGGKQTFGNVGIRTAPDTGKVSAFFIDLDSAMGFDSDGNPVAFERIADVQAAFDALRGSSETSAVYQGMTKEDYWRSVDHLKDQMDNHDLEKQIRTIMRQHGAGRMAERDRNARVVISNIKAQIAFRDSEKSYATDPVDPATLPDSYGKLPEHKIGDGSNPIPRDYSNRVEAPSGLRQQVNRATRAVQRWRHGDDGKATRGLVAADPFARPEDLKPRQKVKVPGSGRAVAGASEFGRLRFVARGESPKEGMTMPIDGNATQKYAEVKRAVSQAQAQAAANEAQGGNAPRNERYYAYAPGDDSKPVGYFEVAGDGNLIWHRPRESMQSQITRAVAKAATLRRGGKGAVTAGGAGAATRPALNLPENGRPVVLTSDFGALHFAKRSDPVKAALEMPLGRDEELARSGLDAQLGKGLDANERIYAYAPDRGGPPLGYFESDGHDGLTWYRASHRSREQFWQTTGRAAVHFATAAGAAFGYDHLRALHPASPWIGPLTSELRYLLNTSKFITDFQLHALDEIREGRLDKATDTIRLRFAGLRGSMSRRGVADATLARIEGYTGTLLGIIQRAQSESSQDVNHIVVNTALDDYFDLIRQETGIGADDFYPTHPATKLGGRMRRVLIATWGGSLMMTLAKVVPFTGLASVGAILNGIGYGATIVDGALSTASARSGSVPHEPGRVVKAMSRWLQPISNWTFVGGYTSGAVNLLVTHGLGSLGSDASFVTDITTSALNVWMWNYQRGARTSDDHIYVFRPDTPSAGSGAAGTPETTKLLGYATYTADGGIYWHEADGKGGFQQRVRVDQSDLRAWTKQKFERTDTRVASRKGPDDFSADQLAKARATSRATRSARWRARKLENDAQLIRRVKSHAGQRKTGWKSLTLGGVLLLSSAIGSAASLLPGKSASTAPAVTGTPPGKKKKPGTSPTVPGKQVTPKPTTPKQSTTPKPGSRVVVVRRGDTLWGIATENGDTLQQLEPLNPEFDWALLDGNPFTPREPGEGRDPDLIYPGDRIKVPTN